MVKVYRKLAAGAPAPARRGSSPPSSPGVIDSAVGNEHFTKPYIQALGERAAELLDGAPQVHFLEALPAGHPAKGSIAGA